MSLAKRMRKRSIASMAALSISLGAVPAVVTAPQAQAQGCTPIHVVSIKGTGGTHSNDVNVDSNLAFGYRLDEELKRVYPGKISSYNVPYPASMGAVVSLFQGLDSGGNWIGGTEQVSMGKSVKVGVERASKNMADRKRQCGDTKFVITGFSQGASVAGDLARDISAGKVPGVSADDVVNVVLFADPGRSSNSSYDSYVGTPSKLYGEIPPGVMGQNFEIISPESGARPDRIGWTGDRPGRFEGMYGKVLSLCAPSDLACSAPPNSFLRALADVEMSSTTANHNNNELNRKIANAYKHFMNNGGVQAVQRQDWATAQRLLAEAGGVANITFADAPAILEAVKELIQIIRTLSDCKQTASAQEALSVFVRQALPNIIFKNLTLESLYNVANGHPIVRDSINGALRGVPGSPTIESIYRDASKWSFLIDLVLPRITDKIMEGIADRTGLPKVESGKMSTFTEQAVYGFIEFGPNHMSYWNDGNIRQATTRINGMSAADYSIKWVTDSVGKAIRNESYIAPARGNALRDASLEKSIEIQPEAGKPVCTVNNPASSLGEPAPGGTGTGGTGTGNTGTSGTGTGSETGGTGNTGTGGTGTGSETGGTGNTGTGGTGTGSETGGTGTGNTETGGTGTGSETGGTGTGNTGTEETGTGNTGTEETGTGNTGAGTETDGNGTGGTGTGNTGTGTDNTGVGTETDGTGTGGTETGTGTGGTGTGNTGTGTDNTGAGTETGGNGTGGTGTETGGTEKGGTGTGTETGGTGSGAIETGNTGSGTRGNNSSAGNDTATTQKPNSNGAENTTINSHGTNGNAEASNIEPSQNTVENSQREKENVSDENQRNSILASTGANVGYMVLIAMGLILMAGAVLFSRRKPLND